MKRFTNFVSSLVVAVVLVAAPARTHFIWLLPDESDKDKPAAKVVFNDVPKPGEAELINKIDKVAVYARGLDLKEALLKTTEGKDARPVDGLEKRPQVLAAVLKYGVFQKGDEEPALVYYYAKTYLGEDLKKAPPKDLMKPWDKMALEIVPIADKKNTIEVLWQGKPLADAEVVLNVPGKKEPVKGKTNADGRFTVVAPEDRGLYGIRAVYTEKAAGEFENKKYSAIRHHATLTFPVEFPPH